MANQEQNPPQQEHPFVVAKQITILQDSPNMYKEYLAEFWNSAKALENSKYVPPPSIDIVRPWFETISYGEAVPAKGTFKKSLLPPWVEMKESYGDRELTLYPAQVFSVNNWELKPNQPEEPPFTDHMLAIWAADMPVVFKAPKTSSKSKSVSQGTKPGAKLGHKKLLTSSK
ncbi:hypothetical protein Tco_0989642 [Tanacetum coccineum]|uniref:Uncharacterized protein n=1 Tax=Tanacetum coccineum TaxID=301880 RepID=A0ABQ5EUY9_9ASTR